MEKLNGRQIRLASASRTLARTAVVAALSFVVASPAASAVIFVTTTEQKISSNDPADPNYRPGCSLQEAIFSANRDENTAIAGYTQSTREEIVVTTQCAAGSGDDIIVLPVRAMFELSRTVNDADNPLGPTATPLIQSTVTIRANGSTLQATPAADFDRYFRLFSVGGFGQLTLTRAYVRGFTVKGGDGGDGGGGGGMGAGGAIYVFGGRLTVESSTFEGNGAIGGNGGGLNRDSGGGGGGGGGLRGNGGPGAALVTGCTWAPGGGGGGSRSDGNSGEKCGWGGPGGGTLFRGVFSRGGFRCGGNGGSPGGSTTSELGDDGDPAECAGGGGGGGWEGIVTSGNGGRGAYGGGAGGGSGGGGAGGLGGFGGGGGAGWGGAVNAGHGGDGGFGGGGGAASAGLFDGTSGSGGPFAGGGNARYGGGGAGLGGAIFNDAGTVIVRNSTLTNNYAARGDSNATRGNDGGGAIFSVDGHLLVQYATIARNQTTGALGGIVVTRYRTARPPVTFAIENSLIYDNGSMDENGTVVDPTRQCSLVGVSSAPVAGDSNTGKGNLIQGNENCAGVVSVTNPNLGPLQYNGGMTPTMAIEASSPAVDAGDATVVDELGRPIVLDQRRQSRPLNLGHDIGAFEACVSPDRPCLIEPEFSDEELVELTVQATPAGGGTTTPTPGIHRYEGGAIAPISAAPAVGYAFDHWSGDAVTAPTSASTTIVMTGNRSVTANFRLLPDFAFGAVTPLTVAVGGNGTRQVTVTANAAFNQSVSLGVSGAPAGITAGLSPTAVTLQASASAISTLTVALGPAVLPGTYGLSVTGVSGALSHATPVTLTVIASADGIAQVVSGLTALGCVDAGISNALIAKLRQAQAAIAAGDLQTAVNLLHALLNQLQAQRGKHIRTCVNGGATLDGAQLLIDHVSALLASLGTGLRSTAVVGALSAELANVTVTIAAGNKPVATASTDATGFYVFARTTGFQPGASYTATITPPKGYKTVTPSQQTFVWRATQVALDPFTLR